MNNKGTESGGEKYRLGLDLGTNSVGWAAVNLDSGGEPCRVLAMGVRIFPDGLDENGRTSNASARRMARGQRRRRDRYLKRRNELMQSLVEFGLMPPDKADRKAGQQLDPYRLRARALDEPLPSYELGRALFHLAQRRGFKSNRKAGSDKSKSQNIKGEPPLSERINALRESIAESGARTLGEFLDRRHKQHQTVRARPAAESGAALYPDRAMYQAEFDAIRKAQAAHQSLDNDQWDRLREIIFFQRPLRPVAPGWCQFEYGNPELNEPEKRRAAKALPIFQEYRMLVEVNNLRLRVGGEPERALNAEERERILKRLRSGKAVNFNPPTRDLPAGADFNLARGGREKLKGDETARRLSKRECFGSRWFDLSLNQRNEIVKFLLETENDENVRQRATAQWGLSEAQADAVANAALVEGYGDLSETAIRKLLPPLAKGMVYSDAVQNAGYKHHSDFRNDQAHNRLPY